jgi:hypothetical protein
MYNPLLEYEVRAVLQHAEHEAAERLRRRGTGQPRKRWWQRRQHTTTQRPQRPARVASAE